MRLCGPHTSKRTQYTWIKGSIAGHSSRRSCRREALRWTLIIVRETPTKVPSKCRCVKSKVRSKGERQEVFVVWPNSQRIHSGPPLIRRWCGTRHDMPLVECLLFQAICRSYLRCTRDLSISAQADRLIRLVPSACCFQRPAG